MGHTPSKCGLFLTETGLKTLSWDNMVWRSKKHEARNRVLGSTPRKCRVFYLIWAYKNQLGQYSLKKYKHEEGEIKQETILGTTPSKCGGFNIKVL